ncbi:MAG TPA: hypothetical protein ENI37_05935 [Chloroflexi bacterium]|nr:hypothetical protein [Chloroflexota bacterium]
MAKKSRRRRKRSQTPRLSPAQLVQPSGERTGPIVVSAPKATARGLPDLQEEYHYVVTDLKRIVIIAVAMLAVMIVLALLLA